MPDELFDVVDEEDNLLGQAMRSVVHRDGLWHRGAHVILFTHTGKLLVQKRSKDRVHAPSALDCSVSEHLKAGEDYSQAAVRGLAEELGVKGVKIQALIKFRMNYGPNDNEISELFQGFVDPSEVHFDPDEIEQIFYSSLDELEDIVLNKKMVVSYWFEQILKWYTDKPSHLEILNRYDQPRLFLDE